MDNGQLIWAQCSKAFKLSLRNKYLLANVVYFFYAFGMIAIDYGNLEIQLINKLYYFFGYIHLINACMYIWSWEDRYWTDVVMIPEYLNVCGAILYLYSRFVRIT